MFVFVVTQAAFSQRMQSEIKHIQCVFQFVCMQNAPVTHGVVMLQIERSQADYNRSGCRCFRSCTKKEQVGHDVAYEPQIQNTVTLF